MLCPLICSFGSLHLQQHPHHLGFQILNQITSFLSHLDVTITSNALTTKIAISGRIIHPKEMTPIVFQPWIAMYLTLKNQSQFHSNKFIYGHALPQCGKMARHTILAWNYCSLYVPVLPQHPIQLEHYVERGPSQRKEEEWHHPLG